MPLYDLEYFGEVHQVGMGGEPVTTNNLAAGVSQVGYVETEGQKKIKGYSNL
jgi:hypothetical protein